MTLFARPLATLLAGLCLATGAIAADDHGHDRDEVRHFATRSGLHFYAGGNVDVTQGAETAFVAAGTVKVSAPDVREVIAAGGTVDIPDAKAQRIIAAGGSVEIVDGTVDKTIIASGGTVKVHNTKVNGDVILSGGEVELKGDVGGDVIAAGGEVSLAGQYGGDVTLRGRDLKLDPATRIAGNLTYSAHDELVVPQGMVSGVVVRKHWDGGDAWFGDFSIAKFLAFTILALIGMIVGLFLFAAVVLAFAGRYVGSAARSVTERPLESLGLGVLLAVALPVTIVVLMITIIGIPLGLFTLAAYALLFGLGIVVAAYWLGMTIRDVLGHDSAPPRYFPALGWTLIGLVIFTFVGAIPFVGNLAQFFALVTGFGALILAFTAGSRGTV